MKKSAGLLILIIIFGLAFYLLLPNIKSMKTNTIKRNLVSSAKVYGDEVKTLWNSDAIYCDNGTGTYKPTVAIAHSTYYAVVGKNEDNTSLPVIKLDKVDDKYSGYVKIDFTNLTPQFSVFLTDGTYSISTDTNYSLLSVKDVKKKKLDFTFDSSYMYCQGDQH